MSYLDEMHANAKKKFDKDEAKKAEEKRSRARAIPSPSNTLKVADNTKAKTVNTSTGKTSGSLADRGYSSTISDYNYQKNPKNQSNVDKWLSTDYKLSKDEQKQAKKLTSDYFKKNNINASDTEVFENSILAEQTKINNFNNMSDAEKARYNKMMALNNKVSNTYALVRGIGEAVPLVDVLAKKAESEKKSNPVVNKYTVEELSENAEKQSPIAKLGGNLLGQAATYGLANAALEGVSAFDNAGKTIANKIPKVGEKGAEAVANILRGQTADTLLDTLPKAVSDVQEGKSADEVLGNALKNQGVNLAFNAGFEVAPKAISALIGKLKNKDNTAKTVANTASNYLDEEASKITNADELQNYIDNVRKANSPEEITENVVKNADSNVAKAATNSDVLTPEEVSNLKKGLDNSEEITEPIVNSSIKSKLPEEKHEALKNNLQALKEAVDSNASYQKINGIKRKIRNSLNENMSDLDASQVEEITNAINGVTFKEGDSPITKAPYTVDEAYNKIADIFKTNDDAENIVRVGNTPESIAENAPSSTTSITVNPNERATRMETQTEPVREGKVSDTFTYDDVETGNPDKKTSKLFTNTGVNSGVVDASELSDPVVKEIAEYEVHHENDTFKNAMQRFQNDAEGEEKRIASGQLSIATDSDVDTSMLIVEDLKSQERTALESGNEELATELNQRRMSVLGKLREAATRKGQAIQALAKWNRTADGAVINAESIMSETAEKWAKRASNRKAAKTNSRLANILSQMGNDSRKAANAEPKVQKTLEQLTEEVKNTFTKEMAGIEGQFSDEDYKYIASLLDEKVDSQTIEDEITQKLLHGDFYTIDEGIEAKKQFSNKLQSALNKLTDDETIKATTLAKTLDDIKAEVRNTLEKESSSVYGDFTDDDVNYLANLVNNGATTEELVGALNKKLSTGNFDIDVNTQKQVNDIFDNIANLPLNSKERVEGEIEAYALLAKASTGKASLWDKFESWRYLSMLGNAKTMIRNTLGNKVFGAIEGVSNTLAAALESGYSALKGGDEAIDRTKALINPIKDADYIKNAKRDADEFAYRQLSGTKWKDTTSAIKDNKEVFSSRLLKGYQKLTDKGLSDYSAMRDKYATSLVGFLKAHGMGDVSTLAVEDEIKNLQKLKTLNGLSDVENQRLTDLIKQKNIIDKGRDYAIEQAKHATFHDDNEIAQKLSEWSTLRNSDELGEKVVGYAVEGLLPFKKTPANILRSGIEYSPLGILKTLSSKTTSKGVTSVIESLSKNLTGTGIMALGYVLADKGRVITNNDDQEYTNPAEGKQQYSLKIGNKTFTIDFLAPSVMPFLVGAEMANKRGTDSNFTLNDFFDALESGDFDSALNQSADFIGNTATSLANIASPIMETSMLSGLNDALEDFSQNGLMSGLGQLAMQGATGYVTQGVPTLLKQAARVVDPTRRSTYSEKTGLAKTMDRSIEKTKNGIPFLSKTNEEYVDSHGRTQNNSPSNNVLGRAAYQFLSPTYIQNINETKVDKGSDALYEQTGNSKALLNSELKHDIGGTNLSKSDFTTWSKEYGTTREELRNMMLDSDYYKNLSDTDKVKALTDMDSVAKNISDYNLSTGKNDLNDEQKGKAADSKDAKNYIESGKNLKTVFENIIKDSNDKTAAESAGIVTKDGSANTDLYSKLTNVYETDSQIENYGKANSYATEKYGKGISQLKKEEVIETLETAKMSTDDCGKAIIAAGKASEKVKTAYENGEINASDVWKAYKSGDSSSIKTTSSSVKLQSSSSKSTSSSVKATGNQVQDAYAFNTGKSMTNSSNTEVISYLNRQSGMSDEAKGKALYESRSSVGKKAEQAKSIGNFAGYYIYCKAKTVYESKKMDYNNDGKTKEDERIRYFKSLGLSDSDAQAYAKIGF